jgi:spore coat protein U-like protein
MTTRTYACAIAALFCTGIASPAFAQSQTATANLNVSATVADHCAISTSPVAFSAVNVTAASAPTAQGGITVKCTNGTAWVATAGLGQNASGSARRMVLGTDPGKFLTYELFRNAGLSDAWGSSSGDGFSDSGTGSDQTSSIYARLPLGQHAATLGAYADTVVVTVTYP